MVKLLKKETFSGFMDFHNTAKAFHMNLALTCEFTMEIWKVFFEYLSVWLSPFTKCDMILINPQFLHFPGFQEYIFEIFKAL